ncbi:MAG: O-antigen ligase family protein [Thermodesulfobacteriota bacterium]|nr:O-antigen ligase family protein [Thermodesulfobacteriota bacterium]
MYQLRKLKLNGKAINSLNISIPLLMGIFLFFNPFPHTTTIKEICFYLSAFIVLLLLVFKKTAFSFKTPLSIPFTLFVLWSFFGLFFALDKPNSIHDFYAHLLKYLAFYYLLVNFFNTKKRLGVLIWIIILSAAAFSTWAITYFYFFLGNDIATQLGLGFTEIPINIIGIVTLFAIILSLYLFRQVTNVYRKTFLVICLIITSLATLLTQTRGTLLAMVFSLTILSLKNKKVLMVFTVSLLIAIAFLPVRHRLNMENIINKLRDDPRTGIAYNFIEVIKDYPITGIGFGMQTYADEKLLDKYNARVPTNYRQPIAYKAPHNLLIDVAVRLGLVGLVLYLYIIFAFIQMGWKKIKYGKDDFIRSWGRCLMAAFVAVFIQGMFENTHSGPPAIVLYAILAMMTILWRLNMKSDNQLDIKSAPG